jgi:hypothetical protein
LGEKSDEEEVEFSFFYLRKAGGGQCFQEKLVASSAPLLYLVFHASLFRGILRGRGRSLVVAAAASESLGRGAEKKRTRGHWWSPLGIEIDDDERVVAAVGGEQRALAGQADAIDKAL